MSIVTCGQVGRWVHDRVRRPAVSVSFLALVLGGGCASAYENVSTAADLSAEELIERTMDPTRPPNERVTWARKLDPAGQQLLEQQLLAELPEYWGLEWSTRLALLDVVGGPSAISTLEHLIAARALPQGERAQRAITSLMNRLRQEANQRSADGPDSLP
jgi:hypothetical protein